MSAHEPLLPPHERPECTRCGKRLKPQHVHETRRVETAFGFASRMCQTGLVRGYGFRAEGLFCTLRCGYLWACKHVRAGCQA